MNEQLFAQLNPVAQAKLLWLRGELMADRNDSAHRITLYKLFSFYVEVYCDLNFTAIEGIKLITSIDDLKNYHNQNNIGFSFAEN